MANKIIQLGDSVSLIYTNDTVSEIIINGVNYKTIPLDEIYKQYELNRNVHFIYFIKRKSDNKFYIGKCSVSNRNRARIRKYFGSSSVLKKTFTELRQKAKELKMDYVELYEKYFDRYIIDIQPNDILLTEKENQIVSRELWTNNEYCLNEIDGGRSPAEIEHNLKSLIASKLSKIRYKNNPKSVQPLFEASNEYWSKEENRIKQSIHGKEVWQRIGYREKMSNNRKKRLSTAEARKQQSINAIKGWENKSDEDKKQQLERLQNLWDNEERHEKHSKIISDKFKNNEWHKEWDKKFYASIQSDEWKQKNMEHMKELHRIQSEKAFQKREMISVELYDINDVVVKKFDTMNIAIEYIKNLNPERNNKQIYANIKNHLKGKLRTAFGYKWKTYTKE